MRPSLSALKLFSVVFLAMVITHGIDHVRQGRSLGTALLLTGAVSLVAAGLVVGLSLTDNPSAPLAALAVGLVTAPGLVAVHLIPRWNPAFSDPYPGLGLDAFSWLSLLAYALSAVVIATLGGRLIRSRRTPTGVS